MSQPHYANHSNDIAIKRDTNPYDTVTSGRAPKSYYNITSPEYRFEQYSVLDTLPLYIYNVVFDTFVFSNVRSTNDITMTPRPFIIAHRELLYGIRDKYIIERKDLAIRFVDSIIRPSLVVGISLADGQKYIGEIQTDYLFYRSPNIPRAYPLRVHHKIFEKDTFWVDGCQWTLDKIKLYNIPLTRNKYTYTFDAVFINTDCLPEYKNKYGKCVCGIK